LLVLFQLNSIQNEVPGYLLEEGTGAVYMKAPAGVTPKLKIPIRKILEKAGENRDINSAKLTLKGYTEKETQIEYDFGKPQYLLLIDKDSVNDLFINRKLADGISSTYAQYSSATNSYEFSNIAAIIKNYKDRLDDEPEFVVLPVAITMNSSSTAITAISSYFAPANLIFRSDEENMKLKLIFSDYK